MSVTFAEIEEARRTLAGAVAITPCIASPVLSRMLGPRSGSSWRTSSAPARSSRAVPWSSSLASRPSSAPAASSPCRPAITPRAWPTTPSA